LTYILHIHYVARTGVTRGLRQRET